MPLFGTDELEVDDREVRDDEGVNERPEDADDVENLFSSRSVKL